MQVFGVLSGKGGAGKSTFALNLARFLSLKKGNNKTVLIDCDPQGTASFWAETRPTAPGFDVAKYTTPNLHEHIADMANGYDNVVIDGPPRDTALFRSATLACDKILIPLVTSAPDLWSTLDFLEIVKNAGKLPVCRVVLNRVRPRTTLAKEFPELAKETLNIPFLKHFAGDRVAYAESISTGRTVFDAPVNKACFEEMTGIFKEFLK